MSKIKKLCTGVLSIGVIAAPMIATVACGSSDNGPAYRTLTSKYVEERLAQEKAVSEAQIDKATVTFGFRSGDMTALTNVMTEFNKLNKGHIKGEVAILAGQDKPIDVYSTKSASGTMPGIFVGDLDTVAYTINHSTWAEAIDLDKIFKSEELYNVHAGQPSPGDVSDAIRKTQSNDHGVSFAVPLGIASNAWNFRRDLLTSALVAKTGWTKEDANHHKVLTTSAVIDPYLPGETDSQTPQKVTGHPFAANDGEGIEHFIQRYINESAQSGVDPVTTANPSWYGRGQLSMFQRIVSISKSIGYGNWALPAKEIFSNFGVLAASVPAAINKATGELTQAAFNEHFLKADGTASDALVNGLWNTIAGYVNVTPNSGAISTSFVINGDTNAVGELETVFNKTQPVLAAYQGKWAHGFISDGLAANDHDSPSAADKADAAKKIMVISSPYGSVGGTESYIINKSLSPAQRVVAKRFLKFCFNTEAKFKNTEGLTIAEQVAGPYVSSIKSIQNLQAKAIQDNAPAENKDMIKYWHSGELFVEKADGTVTVDGKAGEWQVAPKHDGLTSTLIKKVSEGDWYNVFEGKVWSGLSEAFKSTDTKKYWTKAEFVKKLNSIISDYHAEMEIA